jgi:16S rRNA C967 or C1407 C5-methylase (RsmB/RsmF family)
MGGKVVYSTCALSRTENDGVIERVFQKLEKKQHQRPPKTTTSTTSNDFSASSPFHARILTGTGGSNGCDLEAMSSLPAVNLSCFRGAERTQFGWQILPDRTGWGPIYAAVLEKIQINSTPSE